MKKAVDGRNTGIDLLRVISTYCIILLHIMGHGGIRDSLKPGNINYYVMWFVMLASFCGVNCFALISGYVGYHETVKPHRSARFIDLWCQVVFYCVITVSVFKFIKMPGIGFRDFIEAFFPVMFEKYWYFSAYLGVFIAMPLINKCVREFSKLYLAGMIVIGTGALSFLATLMTRYSDPFSLNGGYGAVWLIFLYFIGAMVKKYKIENLTNVSVLVSIIAACIGITWIWKVVLISVVGHGIDDLLVIYISPTILLMSVCQLLLFSKLRCSSFISKVVSVLAPTTFGIYLFQDSNYFRQYVVSGQYTEFAFEKPLIMVGLILLTGFIQFFAGFLIDKCRGALFYVIKIKRLSRRVGDTIDTTVEKIIEHVEKILETQS